MSTRYWPISRSTGSLSTSGTCAARCSRSETSLARKASMLTSSPEPRGALAQRGPAGGVLPVGMIGRRAVGIDVVVFGIEGAFRIGDRLVEIDEVGLARRRRLFGLGEFGRLGGFEAQRRLGAFVRFEQRIALELCSRRIASARCSTAEADGWPAAAGVSSPAAGLASAPALSKAPCARPVSRLLMRVLSNQRALTNMSPRYTRRTSSLAMISSGLPCVRT